MSNGHESFHSHPSSVFLQLQTRVSFGKMTLDVHFQRVMVVNQCRTDKLRLREFQRVAEPHQHWVWTPRARTRCPLPWALQSDLPLLLTRSCWSWSPQQVVQAIHGKMGIVTALLHGTPLGIQWGNVHKSLISTVPGTQNTLSMRLLVLPLLSRGSDVSELWDLKRTTQPSKTQCLHSVVDVITLNLCRTQSNA